MRDGKAIAETPTRSAIPLRIDGLSAAKAALSSLFAGQTNEWLVVLHLSDEMEHLQFSRHRGDIDRVIFPFRKILADVVELGTKGLILAHNHPSGDPMPSTADFRIARRLADLTDSLDVRVLDHLIYAAGEWVSFREKNLL